MDVSKEVIEYKRSDGIDLSATLYLPKGYDVNKKQKATHDNVGISQRV